MSEEWPFELGVVQVRVARPTGNLDAVVRFYGEGLGLAVLGSFHDHAGYSGVMLGLPGYAYHLEFTEQPGDGLFPPPSRDNLLVFYIPDAARIAAIVSRLSNMGYVPVPPENPYWQVRGVTIPDPDGWRVVLMNTGGI